MATNSSEKNSRREAQVLRTRYTIDTPPAQSPLKEGRRPRVSVAPQKMHEHVHTAPKKPFVDHYDLPANYGSTYLTLIARDPHWMYVYWEVSPSSFESARNACGDQVDHAARVLRMYDVTSIDFNGNNANHWFDIEVGPHANNWYVNVWTDNVSYCAELGVRLHDGRFIAFARSNAVTMPRKAQSWRTEQIWMEVKESREAQQPFVIGSIHKAAQEWREAKKQTPPPAQNIRKGRKIYLTEEDIRQYYSRLSPLLRDIISKRIAAKGAHVRRGGKSLAAHRRAVTLDEFKLSGLTWGQFVKKLLGGASEELVLIGASESAPLAGGASEQSQRLGQERKFFFEIGTELIVYGRTEPDAEVRLGGKIVPLRADGTFTLRFALPDGKIPLDFTATSNDKVETREITTAVERAKTKYNP